MPTFEGIPFLGKPTRVDADTHNGARNKPNEDRFGVFTGPGDSGRPAQFLVVADGVTSTHGGERASDIAVRVLQQNLQAPTQPATNGRTTPKSLRDRLADAIHRANQEILETARKDPDLKGMSTTLVVAAIDGDQAIVMHLGDSRAYLIRDGKAHQLTRDHTWVQEALEEGRITREQAANHPNKHVILRYLGDTRGISIDQGVLDPARPAIDIDETEVGRQQSRATDTTLTLRPGDALLLCSDGLYGRITDGEMAAAVTKFAPEKAVKSMIDEAVKRDEPDNITIVLWTTADVASSPVAASKTRRPALLLAAAGALLVLLAIFIFMRPGAAPPQPTPASEVAAAVTVAATETALEVPTEAPPAETAPATATEAPTEAPTETPAPTATSLASTPVNNPPASPADQGQTPPGADMALSTESVASNMLATGTANVIGALEGSAAPTSTATAATKTPIATSTPMATSTPRPTNTLTATPTPARATPSAPPAGSAAATPPVVESDTVGGPTVAQIIQPADNHSSNTSTIFKWVPDTPLAPGQEFEIVFWKASGESEGDARGIFHSSPATEVTQPLNVLPPDTWRWALILVQSPPNYARIRTLAGPFTLTVPGEKSPDPDPTNSPDPDPTPTDAGTGTEK